MTMVGTRERVHKIQHGGCIFTYLIPIRETPRTELTMKKQYV